MNCFAGCKFLLQTGASPNLADSNGVTPLMHAIMQVSILKFVMEKKRLITGAETGLEIKRGGGHTVKNKGTHKNKYAKFTWIMHLNCLNPEF